jgi:hypothetical protein
MAYLSYAPTPQRQAPLLQPRPSLRVGVVEGPEVGHAGRLPLKRMTTWRDS